MTDPTGETYESALVRLRRCAEGPESCRNVAEGFARALRCLRESERTLSTLLSNLPGMVYRCRNDPSWTMLFVSEGCVKLTGYLPSELIDNFRISYADLIHPDDRQRVWDEVQAAVAQYRPFELEYRIRTLRGEEKWVWEQGCAVLDKQGQVTALEGFITDTTARRRAEDALRQRARRQAVLAEIGQRALEGLDLDPLMQEATEVVAETLGVEFCKVLVLEPDGASLVLRAGVGWQPDLVGRARVNAGRESQAGFTLLSRGPVIVEDFAEEKRFKAPPLLWMHGVRSGMSVVIGQPARPFGVLGAHSTQPRQYAADDVYFLRAMAALLAAAITRRQAEEATEQARAEAARASRAKSEFLARMSHELRTPMTAILGFTEILEERVTDASASEACRTIRRNADYLLELINDVLDLSRIEAGRMTLERRPCSPVQVLREVRDLLGPRASQRGLRLRWEFRTPIPAVMETDPTRLRQILINLVGNAIKFTEAGEVRVAASLRRNRKGQDLLTFDIIDTGIGISPEHVERLFRPFSQADTSMTRRFGGTGLGLVISRKLARALGGEVRLVRSEPGTGSHFRAKVAAAGATSLLSPEEALRALEAEAPVSLPADPWPRLAGRVLVAEDGPDNARLIEYLLRRAGVSVTVVGNGQEAVEAVVSAQRGGRGFDAVLMDIQMPVMDGCEATRRIRAAGYQGPVIALTAHAMRDDRERCLAAGCDDYLAKPFDRDVLLRLVGSFLRAGATRRARGGGEGAHPVDVGADGT